jgi:hypothetical protein
MGLADHPNDAGEFQHLALPGLPFTWAGGRRHQREDLDAERNGGH